MIFLLRSAFVILARGRFGNFKQNITDMEYTESYCGQKFTKFVKERFREVFFFPVRYHSIQSFAA